MDIAEKLNGATGSGLEAKISVCQAGLMKFDIVNYGGVCQKIRHIPHIFAVFSIFTMGSMSRVGWWQAGFKLPTLYVASDQYR
jgi:hypothetical protein